MTINTKKKLIEEEIIGENVKIVLKWKREKENVYKLKLRATGV